MSVRIPLARPEITVADREAVMQVLETSQLSMGPRLAEFERAVCEYTGAKYAVAVNSGTSALHLAVRALDVPRGSEVILPSFTFSALLNVILQEELQPKFVDVDPATYNCTPDAVLAAVTPRTRLVLVVHTFGFPVDARSILSGLRDSGLRAKDRKVHVIEDACEALGAEVRGSKAGTVGDAGSFAFYPNKQITTGEGGMLVTADEQLAKKCEQLRNQGRDPALGLNSHSEIGYSYRISDVNCALGTSQLARIEEIITMQQQLAENYDRELVSIAEVVRPNLTSDVGRISWFVYPVQLAAEFTAEDRDVICRFMLQKGVETGRYFPALHKQPVLSKSKVLTTEDTKGHRRQNPLPSKSWALPNTEYVADRVLALPFFNQLTGTQIQQVCSALAESIHELRRRM